MSIALVAHVGVQQSGSANGTSAAVDTTGATLLVAMMATFNGAGTITDVKSNTWTGLTSADDGAGGITGRIYYSANPTVGTGHTFIASGTRNASICVAAFSGVSTTSPFDVQSVAGISNLSTSGQPGSVTPTNANSIIFAGASIGVATNSFSTVDSGFTITDKFNGASAVADVGAYIIETTIAAKNPTFTWAANAKGAVCQAVFIPANVTTTQTITGKARITAQTTQTLAGKARITASTAQTLLGKARVTAKTTQTLLGKARIGSSTTQTLTGKARVTAQTLQTLLGKARITETTVQTLLGKARISITSSQTLTGIARIIGVTPKTLTGKARVTATTVQTLMGQAAIGSTTIQHLLGLSRIIAKTTQTITGKARIFHQSSLDHNRTFEALADDRRWKVLAEPQRFDALKDERVYKVIE